jgi:hypothetical protein
MKTVQQLIDELSAFPKDMPVRILVTCGLGEYVYCSPEVTHFPHWAAPKVLLTRGADDS